ncbi:MAG: hypothetical protein IT580_15505, partial [Verrucomicrobiales bacterium]|nr:hypothetical protein [Verrucomicrobiales bacterium]
GTVKIQITSDEFGVLPEFSHAFEILEYEGSLTYSGAGETRSGRVSLKRTGLETATLAGPLVLTRVATNRLHQFTVGESHLTNEVGEVVPVSLGELERDPDYSMDYFGALSLLNGDPATPEPDYELFYIGIDDPNDTDGDGIPDLTDDLQAPPPAPRLEVRRTASGLELVVTSEVGAEFTLEHASRLAADEWIEDRRVTIKSVPEILAVPLGPQEERYFRLRWP